MTAFARDCSARTTLHVITPTWNVEYDMPAMAVLCRTDGWVVTDDPVGRDDLLCGRCMNVWESLCNDLPSPDQMTKHHSYDEYLKSDHWQHMRLVAREHYGDQCALCGSTESLDVHHRTYARRGREMLKDLTVLCRDCHVSFHRRAS
jgi:hypothetical protein